MPEFIRNIAVGLIDLEEYRNLDKIITDWLEKITRKHYSTIKNRNANEPAMNAVEKESLEKNFAAFVQRMLSSCIED